jgi:hypothetical protein
VKWPDAAIEPAFNSVSRAVETVSTLGPRANGMGFAERGLPHFGYLPF